MFGFFRNGRRVAELERKAASWEHEFHVAKQTEQNAVRALQQANAAAAQARDELAKLKTNLREQNEADLLLVSQRIAKRIMDGEKKEALAQDLALQGNLLSQQQALGNPMQSPWAAGGAINPLAALMAWRH
jgi:hypothetical protein